MSQREQLGFEKFSKARNFRLWHGPRKFALSAVASETATDESLEHEERPHRRSNAEGFEEERVLF
jgi:hypothetical protein